MFFYIDYINGFIRNNPEFACLNFIDYTDDKKTEIDINGYLITPGDYDEFLKRLLEVKSDKSKIESYGKKSRKIIDDNYNIDDYVEKIISIYDK